MKNPLERREGRVEMTRIPRIRRGVKRERKKLKFKDYRNVIL